MWVALFHQLEAWTEYKEVSWGWGFISRCFLTVTTAKWPAAWLWLQCDQLPDCDYCVTSCLAVTAVWPAAWLWLQCDQLPECDYNATSCLTVATMWPAAWLRLQCDQLSDCDCIVTSCLPSLPSQLSHDSEQHPQTLSQKYTFLSFCQNGEKNTQHRKITEGWKSPFASSTSKNGQKLQPCFLSVLCCPSVNVCPLCPVRFTMLNLPRLLLGNSPNILTMTTMRKQ